jgi:peptidoglycan/xylan/chitin deacetylase (PgdA/CDA1 family)
MMKAHGLSGTFFVNSMTIGTPGFLSLADLDEMAMSGHEIGGHSMTHSDLSALTDDEVRRQVCDDRSNLLDSGFAVRSFAYPFASVTPEAAAVVSECGYNSARGLGELRTYRLPHGLELGQACDNCAYSETMPPADPMRTKAPEQVLSDWTTGDLEQQVRDAMAMGGWMQLTFHGVCPGDCNPITTPHGVLNDFLKWLAAEQAAGTLQVRTVGEVIGGPLRPKVEGPVARPAPPGTNAVQNPGLEEQADSVPVCWLGSSFGRNEPEFSLTPDAHGGMSASKLVVQNHVDGDAKLLQTTDLGHCAPSVSPAGKYSMAAWYKSTAPTSFSVQFRHAHGAWTYGTDSIEFPASSEFTLATWTLPPLPPDVTAISFGLGLAQDGELIADDFSLMDVSTGTP